MTKQLISECTQFTCYIRHYTVKVIWVSVCVAAERINGYILSATQFSCRITIPLIPNPTLNVKNMFDREQPRELAALWVLENKSIK